MFALALLLSSTFVYNTVGSIDGGEISKLSLVVNLTNVIHTKQHGKGQEDSGMEYKDFFPHFMFVVRDFSLKLEHGGARISAKQYLEKALEHEVSWQCETESHGGGAKRP